MRTTGTQPREGRLVPATIPPTTEEFRAKKKTLGEVKTKCILSYSGLSERAAGMSRRKQSKPQQHLGVISGETNKIAGDSVREESAPSVSESNGEYSLPALSFLS